MIFSKLLADRGPGSASPSSCRQVLLFFFCLFVFFPPYCSHFSTVSLSSRFFHCMASVKKSIRRLYPQSRPVLRSEATWAAQPLLTDPWCAVTQICGWWERIGMQCRLKLSYKSECHLFAGSIHAEVWTRLGVQLFPVILQNQVWFGWNPDSKITFLVYDKTY